MNQFFKRKLKNGMTVIIEKRDLPVVSVMFNNPYGGGYDSAKNKGLAHFIEHLLFTGTKNRDHEDISREIEKKGGVLNATTYNEKTDFWFKLPSEHLFVGLEIISDMLNNTVFKIEKFEKEKKVIFEEIKMNHDDPQRHVWNMLEENLHDKPFGLSNLGTVKTLSGISRNFVADYFKEVYSPENYIVVMVGNADFEKVCSFLEDKFKPRGKKIKEIIPKKINKKTVEEREGIDQAHYVFAIHAPKPGTKDYLALRVLNAYLADGMSSRLFLEIREKRGLAYTVQGLLDREKNCSYYAIYVGTTKKALPQVEKIILDEFSKIKKMTQEDLDEAKKQVIGFMHIVSESSINVMNELSFAALYGNVEDYYKLEEQIKNLTLQDIKKVAKIGKYSTAAIVPK